MKQYGRDYTTFKFLSHSAGIWRSRCAWQLQVIIIRAQSEEIAISFLATLIELMVPDRFALFFFFLSAQVWTSNSPNQDLSCSSWIKQTHVDKRCKEGIPICLQLHPAKPKCECFRHTHRHTGTNTHTHQRAQSLEEKLKRAGPTPTW